MEVRSFISYLLKVVVLFLPVLHMISVIERALGDLTRNLCVLGRTEVSIFQKQDPQTCRHKKEKSVC